MELTSGLIKPSFRNKIPSMVDILDENKPNNRFESVVKKILDQSQIYTNIRSLDLGDKEVVTGAVSEIAQIIAEMRPDFDDDALVNATADILFSTLCLKIENSNNSESSSSTYN